MHERMRFDVADDPYLRAMSQPAFLDAFRAAYRGRHDPLDALWWVRHPTDPARDGAPSPLAQVARLRADADPRSATRLLDAERALHEDATDVALAIAAAERVPAPQPPPAPAPRTGRRVGAVLAAGAAAVLATTAVLVLVRVPPTTGSANPPPRVSASASATPGTTGGTGTTEPPSSGPSASAPPASASPVPLPASVPVPKPALGGPVVARLSGTGEPVASRPFDREDAALEQTVACQGDGSVAVLTSDGSRLDFPCAPDRVATTSSIVVLVEPGPISVRVVPTGRVVWSASVALHR